MNKLISALFAVVVVAVVAGCASSDDSNPGHSALGDIPDPSAVHTQHIDQSSFKGDWPVTASSGDLICDESKGMAVTFAPDNSKTVYAVNGPAVSWGKKEGWPDAKEIWNGTNWGSFIDAGTKMCEDKS